MHKNTFTRLFLVICFMTTAFFTQAQDKRKGPGEIDKDAPDANAEIHQEKHSIRARERQTKSNRVYSDHKLIHDEKKKLKEYKKMGSHEDYVRAKDALKHYKQHLAADRKRNRQMDVFD